jgi:hypothetical protein
VILIVGTSKLVRSRKPAESGTVPVCQAELRKTSTCRGGGPEATRYNDFEHLSPGTTASPMGGKSRNAAIVNSQGRQPLGNMIE